jgi:hypothetical protein
MKATVKADADAAQQATQLATSARIRENFGFGPPSKAMTASDDQPYK